MQTTYICFLYCRDKLEFTHLRQIQLFVFEIFTVCFEFCILCVSPACEAYGRWTPLFAFSGSFRTPFDEYNIRQWLMLLLHLSLSLSVSSLSLLPLSLLTLLSVSVSPLSPPLSSLSSSPCLTHIGLCPHLPPPTPYRSSLSHSHTYSPVLVVCSELVPLYVLFFGHIFVARCSYFYAMEFICHFSCPHFLVSSVLWPILFPGSHQGPSPSTLVFVCLLCCPRFVS